MFFIFLDKENISFALYELKTYYFPLKIIDSLVLVKNLNYTNLAYGKYYGVFKGEFYNLEEIDLSSLKNKRVAIKIKGKRKESKEIQNFLCNKFKLKLDFKNFEKKLLLFFHNNKIYFGEILKEKDIFLEDKKNLPFNRPYSLKPKFAHFLVNIANDSFIVDPFCGTGTILIRSHFLKKDYLGIDRDWNAVKGSLNNLKYFNAKPNVILSDALFIDKLIKKQFSIVTDPPYGRSSPLFKKKILEIYEKFLEKCNNNLFLNKIVILAPKQDKEIIDLILSYKAEKVGEQYLHKSLTRLVFLIKNLKN